MYPGSRSSQISERKHVAVDKIELVPEHGVDKIDLVQERCMSEHSVNPGGVTQQKVLSGVIPWI